MNVTIVKDYRGQEEIHATGCADLKRRNRPYQLAEAMVMEDVTALEQIYASYWDCIADESVGQGDYPTLKHVWYAWQGEFTVKPCAAALEPMADPAATDSPPAAALTREAKRELGALVLAHVATLLPDADALALAGFPADAAAAQIAAWMSYVPADTRPAALPAR